MENKRNLLKEAVEKELESRGLNLIPVIDSYIVFSAPKGTNLRIDDYYKKEKYCRQGKLQYIVNDYESTVKYSTEEVEVLKEILDGFETSQKGFEIKINFNEIFEDFLNMMKVLEQDTSDEPNNEKNYKSTFAVFGGLNDTFCNGTKRTGIVAAGLITGISAVLATMIFSTVNTERNAC